MGIFGEEWLFDPNEFDTEAAADAHARSVDATGYQTLVVPKYRPWEKVMEAEKSKSKAEAMRDQMEGLYGKSHVKFTKHRAKPGWLQPEYDWWRVQVQKPYWMVKKKKLTVTEQKTKTAAKQQQVALVQAEAAKAQAEDPVGSFFTSIKNFFEGLFKPADFSQFKLPEVELPEIEMPQLSGFSQTAKTDYGRLMGDDDTYGDELI